ncbi:MAG: ribulose-phosphate 3-epimerase [Alphaproteobacteria bacterium]|nr:ribulose-phosphate 3-epimerase [Alphaproteobacteria bacterium]
MNLTDGAFLCLDIGSSGVRAVGARVSFGRIKSSATVFFESMDAAYAVKSAVDSLEEQIGARFDSAYVTGNFGDVRSEIFSRKTSWGGEHKILPQDVLEQIMPRDEDFFPMHIIPLRYDLGGFQNVSSAVGHIDKSLDSLFHSISYPNEGMAFAKSALREAHLESEGFFDPMFLMGSTVRSPKESAAFIDFGATSTTVSVWTARGPMLLKKFDIGGIDITRKLSEAFHISMSEAERLKIAGMTLITTEMDRFTPADARYEFSRFDISDNAMGIFRRMMSVVETSLSPALEKYRVQKIFISGGGSGIPGLADTIEQAFGVKVENLGPFAAVNALADFIWNRETARIQGYLARRKKWEKFFDAVIAFFKVRTKKRHRGIIPIMPSTQSFDMRNAATYAKFANAGIGIIHVEVMDGFYVEKILGGIDEIKFIRAHTTAHLYVHLMTENPAQWAAEAIAAGADTIIVSSGTNGVLRALREIKAAGKRAGIALHPESPIDIIAPILRDLDDVSVMSVVPGPSGQKFLPAALSRVAALANTRKKHNLKFRINVDGGINPETAKQCWDAGADMLTSGNYLAKAPDFAAAVHSLMK